jgi:hypothetical protein
MWSMKSLISSRLKTDHETLTICDVNGELPAGGRLRVQVDELLLV